MQQAKPSSGPSRRDFMKTSTAVAVGAALAATYAGGRGAYAAENNTLKVGLIGCGGRGGGAAIQALNADPNTELVAIGDMFKDRADDKLKQLLADPSGDRVKVKPDHVFSGWDAYKSVIEASDVVLLATPPHFRPLHLRAVLDAGKHCFCEKPVAVDLPGIHKVQEAVALAKQKNLNLVSGLCYRYDDAKVETMKRIHDGAVGEIVTLQGMYNTGPLWSNPRKQGWSDMEWQLRNWLYFTWLSGDHIVEQHIHTLDKMLWIMKDVPPLKVTGNGGRTVRTQPEFGNIYDHHDTVYEWENGVRAFCQTRQWAGCDTDVSDWAFGTKGAANVMNHRISGENEWRRRPSPVNMYDAEHIAMFKAIREGKTINNGDYMIKSTLMGIMGRMATYTGKTIYWDRPKEGETPAPNGVAVPKNALFLMESTEDLTPPKYEMGPLATPPIAVPGQTKFI